MTKMHRPLILCVILTATVPAVTGCHSLGHVDELWLLKQYGDEADAMDEDIDVAEAEYRQIREDADNGRLAAGIDRDTVRERYGDPVYVQDPADRQGAAVMWMYRRPVHFLIPTVFCYILIRKGGSLSTPCSTINRSPGSNPE